jgi:hypothetical protein
MKTPQERRSLLQSKILEAERLLKLSAGGVELALAELEPLVVGDKKLGTPALEEAFEKMRAARQVVLDLQRLLASELAALPPEHG